MTREICKSNGCVKLLLGTTSESIIEYEIKVREATNPEDIEYYSKVLETWKVAREKFQEYTVPNGFCEDCDNRTE